MNDRKLTLRKTFLGNLSVSTTPLLLLSKNDSRLGYTLVNRSATILYLGRNMNISATSTATIRLLQNEILTLMEEEGDDTTEALFGVASGASTIEIVESVAY